MRLAVALFALLAGCSKPNPEVCCLDESDCSSIGVTDGTRPCDTGLACVNHACVAPSCSTDGCGAEAPVCETTTDVCIGCSDESDCARFPDTGLCDTDSGACVECLGDSDCGADKPVCDSGACRICQADSECASGACGEDGTCVAEANIVYLDPGGADSGTCARSSALQGAAASGSDQTSLARNHVVMAPGTYTTTQQVLIRCQRDVCVRRCLSTEDER